MRVARLAPSPLVLDHRLATSCPSGAAPALDGVSNREASAAGQARAGQRIAVEEQLVDRSSASERLVAIGVATDEAEHACRRARGSDAESCRWRSSRMGGQPLVSPREVSIPLNRSPASELRTLVEAGDDGLLFGSNLKGSALYSV